MVPPVAVRETSWAGRRERRDRSSSPEALDSAAPGSWLFQPDGKVLVRFGDRLLYFVGDRPLNVAVPAEHRHAVATSRWLTRGPGGGFALIGPRHVLLIRGSRFLRATLPARAGGGEVGEIHAAIGAGGVFGVVTAEIADGDGGPELWTSNDGAVWAPRSLPLRGRSARRLPRSVRLPCRGAEG